MPFSVHHTFRVLSVDSAKHALSGENATASAGGGKQKIVMPECDDDGNNQELKFKNFKNKFPAPFVIYADFESVLTKVESEQSNTMKTKKHESNTMKTQKHEPCGFCLYAVSTATDIQFEPVVYRGTDPQATMDEFYSSLFNLRAQIGKYQQRYKDIKKMKITPEQRRNFEQATHCHIGEKSLSEGVKCRGHCEEDCECSERVRDHCHITGHYIGAAHNACNLNRNQKNAKVPVIIHNLKNYDAHNIIAYLDKEWLTYKNKKGEEKTHKIDVIANNDEKFI